MLYRIVHALSENFALAVFWMYVVAFIGGMLLIFVFPPATVLLVFLSLLMLIPAVIGSKVLGATDRAMVRHFISSNRCPICREVSEGPIDPGSTWHCEHCHAAYLRSGAALIGIDSAVS